MTIKPILIAFAWAAVILFLCAKSFSKWYDRNH